MGLERQHIARRTSKFEQLKAMSTSEKAGIAVTMSLCTFTCSHGTMAEFWILFIFLIQELQHVEDV